MTFGLLQLAPGDFLSQMAENPSISAETLEAMRRNFGLDRPWSAYAATFKMFCCTWISASRFPVDSLSSRF